MIASRLQNDEFAISPGRLSQIENDHAVPNVYRLYSLSVVLQVDLHDLLRRFGVPLTAGLAQGRLFGFKKVEEAYTKNPESKSETYSHTTPTRADSRANCSTHSPEAGPPTLDIFFFGGNPTDGVVQACSVAGYRAIRARLKNGSIGACENVGAIILHWKRRRDQSIVKQAKARGVPVLVVTSCLAAAFRAPAPRAELYLEAPTNDEELSTLSIDLADATRIAVNQAHRKATKRAAA
jgi:hypothetical protein